MAPLARPGGHRGKMANRFPSFAIRLVAVIAFLAGGIFLGQASADDFAAQIDAKVKALGVQQSSVELASQKAQRVRRAVVAGDFATANGIARDVLGKSAIRNWDYAPFAEFIDGVFDVKPPELERQLDTWVAADAKSALPLLLRAEYRLKAGWERRGNAFASETSADRMTTFARAMEKALADVNAAIRIDPDIPYAYALRLRILNSHGPTQQFSDAFEAAIAKYPNYYPLYTITLATLQPRWGGSIPEMTAFVDKYAGGAPQFSPLGMLYLSLYRYVLSTASVECVAQRGDQERTAQCVVTFMQKAVSPALEKQAWAALQLYDHTDKYEFGKAVYDIISGMLATTGGDTYAGAVLELAASSMHSDAQLVEQNPGHNDYMIDRLVALSWHYKGFHENEITKYKEALLDAQHAVFPSDDEKNTALADIYGHLSRASEELQRYDDEIAFEQAAVLLGDTWNEHLACSAYFQLKRYDEVVGVCTKAFEDSDRDYTLYWRGQAYLKTGRKGKAAEDLTKIAEGGGYFASGAAIDLSMINFDRDNIQGALEVLNRYDYLYDPSRTRKSDVAVAYNNRCYAYMKLGDLNKALDDCTRSLKYGSIPDAFRKQQELVKLLAKSDNSP